MARYLCAYRRRSFAQGRPRVAVLSPYFPYPLSHGGAVRIYNILREAASEFDIVLFAFAEEPETAARNTPVLDFCARVILFPNPRYREPRWASLDPPEVPEFTSAYVESIVRSMSTRFHVQVLQTEYTQMARYGGDVLTEHDVTFDLYNQIHARQQSLSSWWNAFRWRRFERAAVKKFRRVVVMSSRDAKLLGTSSTAVIPNGVDLERFQPAPGPATFGICCLLGRSRTSRTLWRFGGCWRKCCLCCPTRTCE